MAALTVPYAALHVLQVLWDAGRSVYCKWHWQYRYEWLEWFGYFSEAHRKQATSLGAKPELAPEILHTVHRPPERLQ